MDQNEEYRRLHGEGQKAREAFDRRERQHQTFVQEAARKLQAYRSNPLFTYLVKRNFDPSKRNGGLTQRLDGWVARVVHYRENKKNFDYLNVLPGEMEKEIERRRAAVEGLAQQVARLEEETAARHNLPVVMEQGIELGKRREHIMQDMDETDQTFARYAEERQQLDNTKGAYHQNAIQRLTQYLRGQSIEELMQRARETEDPDDDRLVQRIDATGNEIEEWKGRVRESRKEQEGILKNLKNLKDIESDFTTKDYEASRSRFPDGFDIDGLLTGLLLGRYSRSSVWDEIDSDQYFKPRETYRSSYSSSWGSSSSSSSGGFGGGGFSGGGGFGGGGFSTGGGF